MTADLLRPRETPDGVVTMDGEADIDRWLREGLPTLGWDGDPTLSLWHNVISGKWEVWRRGDLDGQATLVCVRDGEKVPGQELIRQLVKMDTRKRDVVGELERHNEQVRKAQQAEFSARVEDAADRLGWALGKDLALPAPDGKLYSLGN